MSDAADKMACRIVRHYGLCTGCDHTPLCAAARTARDEIAPTLDKIESTLLWWVTEEMTNFVDKQYGKAEIKTLLDNLGIEYTDRERKFKRLD